MRIDTIVFDLGGVLIDWDPRRVYRQIFDTESEIDWFFDNICTMDWNENQDAGRSLAAATQMKILEYPQWSEHIKAYYGRWEEMLGDAIEDTLAILSDLRKVDNLRLLALTNWSAETFPVALRKFEFLQWFEGIVVSGEEKTRKPFDDIYQIVFDRYQVKPSSALFIDDNLRNVQAAANLGMQTIHFQGDGSLRHTLKELGMAI